MKRHISIFALLLCALGAFAASAGSDYMRLSPIGYRLDAAGDIRAYAPSVVTVTPGDTCIVTSGKPVTLKAVPNRDYKVVRWQKFDGDPTARPMDPIEEFGEGSETASVNFATNVTWMYVAVVVRYDPVRTVKASLSSFARGEVSVSPLRADYQKGDKVTLTAEPAEGYSFVRWSDGSTDHVRTLTVDGDVDLKAYVEPISSRVSFSAGAGSALGVTSKRVTYGSVYGELPVPSRPGFVFSGWTDDEKRTVTAKTAVRRDSDHTLYAAYDAKTYKIEGKAVGEGSGRVDGAGTYAYGSQPELKAVPLEGGLFAGWEDGETRNPRQITVWSNATYVAKFDIATHEVVFTYRSAEGNLVTVGPTTVKHGAALTPPEVPKWPGHLFMGWSTDGYAKVMRDLRVDAVYESETFEIRWASAGAGGGYVTGAGTYAYGSPVTLTAVPDTGSAFVGWEDGETRNPRRITVVSNAAYVARFDVATYDVTFTYRDAAGRPVTTAPTTVEHGGKVDPPAIPEWPEHTFKNWSTEEYRKVTRNLKVEAIYDTMTYSVAFAYRDWQGNCVTTMPQHVASGGRANPPSTDIVDNWTGNTFKGWAPDYNVIGQDTLCEAIYEVNTYTITFSYCDAKGEELQHVEYVRHGEKVPFDYAEGVKNLWTGHQFAYWSHGGQRIADIYNVIATGDMRISAAYEGYARITYAANGGEGAMPMQVYTNYTGLVNLAPNAFTRTGYRFIGWSTGGSGSPKYGDRAAVEVSDGTALALTACWQPIMYTIVFDGNGGTCTVGRVTMTYDRPLEIPVHKPNGEPQTFRDENHELVGFSRLPAGSDAEFSVRTNDQGVITVTIADNLTDLDGEEVKLYAAWKSETPAPPDPPTPPDPPGPQPGGDDLKEALGFTADDPITVTASPADCWIGEEGNRIELIKDCTLSFAVTGAGCVATVKAEGYSSQNLRYNKGEGWKSLNYPSNGQLEFEIKQGETLVIEKSEKNTSVLDHVSGSCVKQ